MTEPLGTPISEIHRFIEKYGSNLPDMFEDLRRVVVSSQITFREDQIRGDFTDGTGDGFLTACKATFEDKEGES